MDKTITDMDKVEFKYKTADEYFKNNGKENPFNCNDINTPILHICDKSSNHIKPNTKLIRGILYDWGGVYESYGEYRYREHTIQITKKINGDVYISAIKTNIVKYFDIEGNSLLENYISFEDIEEIEELVVDILESPYDGWLDLDFSSNDSTILNDILHKLDHDFYIGDVLCKREYKMWKHICGYK